MARRFLIPAVTIIALTAATASLSWVIGWSAGNAPPDRAVAVRHLAAGDSAALFGPELEQALADQVRSAQDAAEAQARADQAAADEAARQAAASQQRATTSVVQPPTPSPAWPTSLQPCDGIYPPCYVKMRESGGNYSAKNPSSTASGAWQFLDTTWNGYGGYTRAMDAPPAVQDEKAAEVWAGGAGCSHWSAC